MKGSESKDSGGRVVLVVVVVLETVVVLACLGSTAALTALMPAASAVIVLEKYILPYKDEIMCEVEIDTVTAVAAKDFLYAQNKTQSSTVQCGACMTIPCSVLFAYLVPKINTQTNLWP